jgi:hypothetical protein
MNKQDILGRSIATTDSTKANGNNYGSDVLVKDGYRIGENKVKAVFRITEAYAAGNFTLQVCAGSSANPTTVVAATPLIDRTTLAVGDFVELPIPGGVLDEYNRINVANSAISATGAMEADLRTTFG